MTTPSDEEVLVTAMDGPIPRGPELQERLQYFTVPILRFRGDAPYPDDVGSGVLLRITDHFFVLTAGHCVKGDFASIVLGVRIQPHRFAFKPEKRNFIYSVRGDFGYFQVSPAQAKVIEAGNRIFLNERSVEVRSAEDHVALGDFYALGGYPRERYNRENEATGASFLVYSTTMAGGGQAPDSNLIRGGEETRREIHMWIPQQGNVNTLTEDLFPVSPGDLRGASGGGWWATHMNRPEWSAGKLKLSGIHQGSGPETEVGDDGEVHRFSRVSLVGNHLALIARDFLELRDHIHATWPGVESYASGL